MLKTTVSLQMLVANKVFVANKVLAANKVGGIEGGGKLIEKYGKLLKIRKLSKLNRKLSKSKNQHPTNATEERNFLISNAKTDFKFWSNFI